MYCIAWSSVAAKTFGNHFGTNVELEFGESDAQPVPPFEVIQSFQQLRSLSGKHSVAYAALGVSFVLEPFQDLSLGEGQVQWRSPHEAGLPIPVIVQLSTLFNSAFGGDVVQLRQYLSHSLLHVSQAQQPFKILQGFFRLVTTLASQKQS